MLMLASTGNSHGFAYPFEHYRNALRREWSVRPHELLHDTLEEKSKAVQKSGADILLFSPPMRGPNGRFVSKADVRDHMRRLRDSYAGKIAFMDVSDNPMGRHFEVIPDVDLYVMPFLFSNPEDYRTEFLGGNKFADFYSRHHGLAPTKENEYHPEIFDSRMPEGGEKKLFALYNWQFMSRIHQLFLRQGSRCVLGGERATDVHCRFHPYSGWCRGHRLDVRDALMKMDGPRRIIASDGKVPFADYWNEISNAKILFSPFGWGEICPKDWEAFLRGCLLMKPSVEHVVSHPQTHIPYETYVPVAWDLSDLEEKTQYYLDHKEERERITANAARAVEAYYNEGGFLGMMGNMIARLGL
jgi:hypothetical protein